MSESVTKGNENLPAGDVDQNKSAVTVVAPMEIDCPSVIVSSATGLTTAVSLEGTNNNINNNSNNGNVDGGGGGGGAMPGDGSGDGETSCTKKSVAGSQRCMKKDDSGISMEKPLDDEEDPTFSDEDKMTNDCGKVTVGKGKGLSKLDVKKAEGIVDRSSPDSGHHESSFGPDHLGDDDEDTEPIDGQTKKTKGRRRSLELDSDDDSDDEVDELMSKTRCLDKDIIDSLRRRVDVAEGDKDGEDNDNATEKSKKLSDDEEDEEGNSSPVNKKLRARHNWFLCPEVVGRQYGVGNRFNNDLFWLRCCGSMHAVERLELMYKMKRHDGCVNTLHFNCSGTRLASGSDDLNVVLWDWTVSEPVLVYDSGHRSNVFQAKFIPFSGDCHIVSCARDGQVRLAELSSTGICKGTRRLAQHRGPAHKLALDYDNPQSFLTCGDDALVYEIDLRESKPEKLLTCKENERKVALYTIFINPGNSYEFAIGGRDHFVRVYDKRKIAENNGTLKMFCPQHLLPSETCANVTCLVYNYNGSEILATYNDEDIYTFDSSHSDGADYTHRYQGHRNNATVKGVNYFGAKSEFIVSGSDCGNIYLWEHDTAQVVNFMAGDEGGVVNCLEPHPHLPILATSGLDDDVKIWVPSCEQPPALAGLRSIMQANKKGREEDRRREPETIDGQMLWYFMHHLRRTARRRARQTGQPVEESTSEENSEDSDDSEDMPQAVQCTPS